MATHLHRPTNLGPAKPLFTQVNLLLTAQTPLYLQLSRRRSNFTYLRSLPVAFAPRLAPKQTPKARPDLARMRSCTVASNTLHRTGLQIAFPTQFQHSGLHYSYSPFPTRMVASTAPQTGSHVSCSKLRIHQTTAILQHRGRHCLVGLTRRISPKH